MTKNLPQPNKFNKFLQKRKLTSQEFHALSNVPAEVEWFANIENLRTRRAYRNDVHDFMQFLGIFEPEEFRIVTRAHIIAWRDSFKQRNLMPNTVRRKLSAMASLFDYLCEKNAITHNPVDGVKRPKKESNEGKTPPISDRQAMALFKAPSPRTLKGKRDRAILWTFLGHGLRREEVSNLRVCDLHLRRGIPYLRVHGKGGKIRNVEAHPAAIRCIETYLDIAGHGDDLKGPLFRPVKNNYDGNLNKPISPDGIYQVVKHYAQKVGISGEVPGFSPHSLRTTAITNALEHGAELSEAQKWAGHSDISTTRIYDKRRHRPENSPTYRIKYKGKY